MKMTQVVYEPSGTLDISKLPAMVRAASLSGFMFIMWNREGLVRRVTPAVFQNAYRYWMDCKRSVQAGRMQAMPADAGRILWEQAVNPTEGQAKPSGPPRHRPLAQPRPRLESTEHG